MQCLDVVRRRFVVVENDRQSELRELADSVSRLVMFEELDEWIARWEETQDSILSRCEGVEPAAALFDLEEGELALPEEGECAGGGRYRRTGYGQSLVESLGPNTMSSSFWAMSIKPPGPTVIPSSLETLTLPSRSICPKPRNAISSPPPE